ncbi:MAG TPA: histidine kinase, partial [Methylophaga aminisulfidivorans]|nr:histidine kinase [Methylophaga aminisulfidivorans]
LTPQQSMQMLYIIRESLSNIVRHSHATFARVVLLLKNSQRLEIQIEDNGIGIDPDAARTDSFGLQIMKERAERIGAELTINPGSDGGTRICLNLTIGDDV